jgi:hypothetical protein
VVTLLTGDANVDGVVNSTDYAIWSAHYGQTVGFVDGDFDGNGTVNSADIVHFYQTVGTNLQSVSLLADLDGDYAVDESDVDTLAGNIGMANPTAADGDLNGDGYIDAEDLDLALAQYGLELSVVS